MAHPATQPSGRSATHAVPLKTPHGSATNAARLPSLKAISDTKICSANTKKPSMASTAETQIVAMAMKSVKMFMPSAIDDGAAEELDADLADAPGIVQVRHGHAAAGLETKLAPDYD
jgi:hypothetical protein